MERNTARCILSDCVTRRWIRAWDGLPQAVTPDLRIMALEDDRGAHRPNGSVIDVATGRVLGRFNVAGEWTRLSADGRFLCSFLPTEHATLLRVPSMTPALTSLPILSAAGLSEHDSQLVGVEPNGRLDIWQLSTGKLRSIQTNLSSARAVHLFNDAIVIDGRIGSDRHGHVVEARSRDGIRLMWTAPGDDLALSNDGRLIAVGGYDCCGVFAVDTGRLIVRANTAVDPLGNPIPVDNDASETHMYFTEDDRRLVRAFTNGLIAFYDLTKPAPTRLPAVDTSGGEPVISYADLSGKVVDAVAFPGGGVAACGGSDQTREGVVRIWRPNSGNAKSYDTTVENDSASRLAVSPDGRKLEGLSDFRLWTLDLSTGAVSNLPMSSDSEAAAGPKGHPVWLDGPEKPFSVVDVGFLGIQDVDLSTWTSDIRFAGEKRLISVTEKPGDELDSLVPSPDGRLLAVLWSPISDPDNQMENILELRDTRTGRILRKITPLSSSPFGSIGKPAFSLDGRLVAAANDAGSIFVWDASSGRQVARMSCAVPTDIRRFPDVYEDGVYGYSASLAFSPDRKLLAACRYDGSIYLYSLKSSLPVAEVGRMPIELNEREALPPSWIAFDASGSKIYGTWPNSVSVWAWNIPKANP